jgi:hypothetical protein
MTPEEEKNYLTNLLIDATAWQVSEGETRSAIELEVIDRIRKLNNMPSIDVVGTPSDQVETCEVEINPVNEKREKQKLFKQRWKADKVRCTENGRVVWHLKTDCHKEVIPGFTTKWRWVWNGNQENENAKKDQVEQMWAEHERS